MHAYTCWRSRPLAEHACGVSPFRMARTDLLAHRAGKQRWLAIGTGREVATQCRAVVAMREADGQDREGIACRRGQVTTRRLWPFGAHLLLISSPSTVHLFRSLCDSSVRDSRSNTCRPRRDPVQRLQRQRGTLPPHLRPSPPQVLNALPLFQPPLLRCVVWEQS